MSWRGGRWRREQGELALNSTREGGGTSARAAPLDTKRWQRMPFVSDLVDHLSTWPQPQFKRPLPCLHLFLFLHS